MNTVKRYTPVNEKKAPCEAWCFTVWKNVDSTYQRLRMIDDPRVHGLYFQKELSPEDRKLHIQGYVLFCRKLSLNQVKEFIGEWSTHCGNRIASHEKAKAYATKVESRVKGSTVRREYQ